MKLKSFTEDKFFRPAMGAALAVLCGLALWQMPLGERCVNASYDYLFRFGARTVTNKVVLVLMDNAAHAELHQERGQPWDRALHAKLLNQLFADGCPLVVFDVHFESQGEAKADAALAEAMRRQGNVVLMAEVDDPKAPGLLVDQVNLPYKLFLDAATHWGIGNAGVDVLETPRRHWPYPSPANHPSLPWAAARVAGAKLDETPEKRWLRYYGQNSAWEKIWSYHLVPTNVAGYFRDKIVFIGSDPPNVGNARLPEEDKFHTPYTRWTGKAVGGVEIMATTFLNLMCGDWLRRPVWWVEVLALTASGLVLGGGLCRVRPMVAFGVAAGAALALTIAAVSLSHFSNFWFPWLVIAGGQVPCALGWALLSTRILPGMEVPAKAPGPARTAVVAILPDTPDYELFDPPFGEGAYGKVWLARNAIGQWQALKAVYQASFGEDAEPYEREFRGIKRYKPVSDKHPGLLRVDFVSRRKDEGYFYYVMELGDAQAPGWEENPPTYRPRDLWSVRGQAEGQRLPARECVRIGLALAEALNFLHQQGLTHRDIKPKNIIFVKGQPKLADVGIVAEILPPGKVGTLVGTPGYMPPQPEPPGTPQADIYALGMVLYVISTGCEPALFPDLSTTLVERTGHADFIPLNAIIIRACHSDCGQRYASAAELVRALQEVNKALEGNVAT